MSAQFQRFQSVAGGQIIFRRITGQNIRAEAGRGARLKTREKQAEGVTIYTPRTRPLMTHFLRLQTAAPLIIPLAGDQSISTGGQSSSECHSCSYINRVNSSLMHNPSAVDSGSPLGLVYHSWLQIYHGSFKSRSNNYRIGFM